MRALLHLGSRARASFREALRSRLKQRQSAGVGANWDEVTFAPKRSKINKTLARHLRAGRRAYEIRVTGGRALGCTVWRWPRSAIEVQNN